MASGVTVYSDITDVMPKFIGPAAFYYDHAGVVKPLVTKYTLPDSSGPTYYIPRFPRLAAQHLVDGVPINQMQKITTEQVLAVTPGEVGIQVVVGKRAARMAKEDVMRAVGKITGNAMALIEDKDLITLFSSVTASKGGAGTTLLVGHLMAAKTRIAGNATNHGSPPFFAVLHEYQYHDIAEGVLALSSGAVQAGGLGSNAEDVLEKWNVSRIGDIEIHRDSNIAADASDDGTGIVMTREALVHVTFSGMETVHEYSNDLRATKINVTSDYGVALFDTNFACRIISDIAEPTN